MGEPILWGALRSVLTNSERPLQAAITGAVTVECTDLGYRLDKLQEEILRLQEMQAAHQRNLRIIPIFIDLRLAYVADWPSAKLLRACGIEDPLELSVQDTRELRERMERENKKRRFMGSVPSVEQLESWAQAATLAAEWGPSGGQSGAADP